MKLGSSLLFAGAMVCVAGGVAVHAQSANNMSFFVTSVGKGDGANLGGLAGADAHCAALAKAAGSSKTNWHAYLSATPVQGAGAVDARDRIGSGPWINAKGTTIARNVDDLHSAKLTKEMLINEKGMLVNGAGDTPNTHDILTGSDSSGRYLSTGNFDTTCKNWTSNSEGSAMLGHHDGKGPPNATARHFTSWNASHTSRSCSQPDLVATGGAGLFYCFATN